MRDAESGDCHGGQLAERRAWQRARGGPSPSARARRPPPGESASSRRPRAGERPARAGGAAALLCLLALRLLGSARAGAPVMPEGRANLRVLMLVHPSRADVNYAGLPLCVGRTVSSGTYLVISESTCFSGASDLPLYFTLAPGTTDLYYIRFGLDDSVVNGGWSMYPTRSEFTGVPLQQLRVAWWRGSPSSEANGWLEIEYGGAYCIEAVMPYYGWAVEWKGCTGSELQRWQIAFPSGGIDYPTKPPAVPATGPPRLRPPAWVLFGTVGGTAGPRSISVPPFALSPPFTMEVWVAPRQNQAYGSRLFDFADPDLYSRTNIRALSAAFCPAERPACSVRPRAAPAPHAGPARAGPGLAGAGQVGAGGLALEVRAHDAAGALLASSVLFTGASAIPISAAPSHVAIAWGAPDASGLCPLSAFLNGVLVHYGTGAPHATDVLLAELRVWPAALSPAQVDGSYRGTLPPGAPLLRYRLDDCAAAGLARVAVDSSGAALHGALSGDVEFVCSGGSPPPPPERLSAPAILSLAATGPLSVAAVLKFTAGEGAARLQLSCTAPGYAPLVKSVAVSDADAAGGGGGVAVALAVEPSFGDDYRLTCGAVAASGFSSTPSVAVAATVFGSASLSGKAQSALLPSGSAAASNALPRVGTGLPLGGGGGAVLVAATALPGYPLGARPASRRLALVARREGALLLCEYDVDAGACGALVPLPFPGLSAETRLDFSFASLSPWPAKDPDVFLPPWDLAAAQGDWGWGTDAYARRASLLGREVARLLLPPSECRGAACLGFAPRRWAGYAYSSGCEEGARRGALRAWPAGACPTASALERAVPAAAFAHDFRHFRAAYERRLYESLSGLSSGDDERRAPTGWLGHLSSFYLHSPSPTGSGGSAGAHAGRHRQLQAERLARAASASASASASAGDGAALGLDSHAFHEATACLDFYDAEPVGAGMQLTPEGRETAAEVAWATGAGHAAMLLQETRAFAFWGRGAALFASWAASGPDEVACSLFHGVAFLLFDAAALAPPGYSPSTASTYPPPRWPAADGAASFADVYPPGASAQAMAADGRLAEGGPLMYHAVVRVPFFPFSPPAEVRPETAVERASGLRAANASFPSPATYRASRAAPSAPRVLRTDFVPLEDQWIVQNERPLQSGHGHGYLEGRFVDPPEGRFAFYVTGDQIVRVRKVDSYQSGMAGSVDGAARIYGGDGWRPSRAEWTSVAAAAYKDGALFLFREVHTAGNTRSFAFGTAGPRPVLLLARRLQRAAARAPSSQLLRVRGVDAEYPPGSFSPLVDVLLPDAPAGVLALAAVDDFAGSSEPMFGFDSEGGEKADPGAPYPLMDALLFVVSEPFKLLASNSNSKAPAARRRPGVFKIHTKCPPGTRWNWEQARPGAASDDAGGNAAPCRPLPAGRYSDRAGLLLDADAPLCWAGSWSGPGSTACTPCRPGTSSAEGASACYACPQHTASIAAGGACTECWAISGYEQFRYSYFTPRAGWDMTCALCPPGYYLSEPGGAQCLACPSHQFSFIYGAVSRCEDCPWGMTPSSDRSTCLPCPEGTYQAVPSGPCARCPAGTIGRQRALEPPVLVGPAFRQLVLARVGQTLACEPCPPGTVPTRVGEACAACPPGTERPSLGQLACAPCRVDFAAPAGGLCAPCPRGFVSTADRLQCTPCAPGTYEAEDRPGVCLRCPENSVAPYPGAAACAPCDPGHVSSSDSRCVECPAGSYRSAAMARCEPAPRGAVAARGAAAFAFCAEGTVPNGAATDCAPCPRGTFWTTNYTCLSCPINTASSSLGALACSPCGAGRAAAADGQTCGPCPAGTYRAEGMPSCEPVPEGTVSDPGRATYAPCGAGFLPNAARDACLPCPKGTFHDAAAGLGLGLCRRCPPASVAPREAMAACEACPAGQLPSPDLQRCAACPAGAHRAENGTSCTPAAAREVARGGFLAACPAGHVPNGPRDACEPCPAGSYQAGDECAACGDNAVAPAPGLAACLPCGEGYASSADGQKCVECMAGFYRHEGMPQCLPAPAGAVAPPASRNFTACAPGSVPNAERSACVPCPAGTRGAEPPGTLCLPCLGNSYTPAAGMTACIECPAGAVVDGVRQGCSPCRPGSFRPANASSCQECPFGTYAGASGASACGLCPPGTEARRDRAGCALCRAGSASRNGTCEACPDGAVSAPGALACAACPAGSVSNGHRSACVPCGPGTHQPQGTNACLPCQSGTWAPAGSARCERCPPGSVASANGVRCIPCDPGTYMPDGASTCVPCPTQHYAPRAGAAGACLPCPGGHQSSGGRAVCFPCDAGFFRPANSSQGCRACPVAGVARLPGATSCHAWCAALSPSS
eukprot:tig00021680_g23027.t1